MRGTAHIALRAGNCTSYHELGHQNVMDQLDQILRAATTAIEAPYFKLPIYGGPPVYRERVYCYELYHQMRKRWPDTDATRYTLNGEVDKNAHLELQTLGVRGQKPDLLVHRPGHMGGFDNYAIIEVKHADVNAVGIAKDLKTLSLFINNVGYKRAIYLIYGTTKDEPLVRRVLKRAATVQHATRVELWLHTEQGQEARHVVTLIQ